MAINAEDRVTFRLIPEPAVYCAVVVSIDDAVIARVVSYTDFITLLFAFFTTMYAISHGTWTSSSDLPAL